MNTQTYQISRGLIDAGLSVIPIKPDASKVPAVFWKSYQSEPAEDTELRQWFANGNGLGILGGKVSGNLEILDFDVPGLYEEFVSLCNDHGLGETVQRLPLVETPSGGQHLYYRSEEPVSGNTPLAWHLIRIPEHAERIARGARQYAKWDGKEYPVINRNGQESAVTIGIETRGEGGYVLAPPVLRQPVTLPASPIAYSVDS